MMRRGAVASLALLVVFLAAGEWGPGLLGIPSFIVPGDDSSHAYSASWALKELMPRAEMWELLPPQQNGRNTLDEILRFPGMQNQEARNLLGRFLFSGDDVLKQVSALSGGERSDNAVYHTNFWVAVHPGLLFRLSIKSGWRPDDRLWPSECCSEYHREVAQPS